MVDEGIVISAAGVTTLAARVNAVCLGFICQVNDHPPAGSVELLGCIDTMRPPTYRKVHTAEGWQA